ncbi:uncharacterized protein METZ01_LOCUS412242 [marine metagenome]|uniref:Uncharacterized protein n=1 Tax=marine metagenome TaxID=408172 RepID=A0A382WMP8_9ZZZZ
MKEANIRVEADRFRLPDGAAWP